MRCADCRRRSGGTARGGTGLGGGNADDAGRPEAVRRPQISCRGSRRTEPDPLRAGGKFPRAIRRCLPSAGETCWRNFRRRMSAPGRRTRHRDVRRDKWPRFPDDASRRRLLLRRWIERLRKQGVSFRSRHALAGISQNDDNGWKVAFQDAQRRNLLRTRTLILALGGASWPQTGSDGGWVSLLANGIDVTPLAASNCGYEVAWPPEFLVQAEGSPLKNVVVRANGVPVAGELLVTKYGLEGGAIYQLGAALAQWRSRKSRSTSSRPSRRTTRAENSSAQGENLLEQARQAWRLSEPPGLARAEVPTGVCEQLAALAKAFPLRLRVRARSRRRSRVRAACHGTSWKKT